MEMPFSLIMMWKLIRKMAIGQKQTKSMIFINKFLRVPPDLYFWMGTLTNNLVRSLPLPYISLPNLPNLPRQQGEECCFKPCRGRNVIRILVNLRAATVTGVQRNRFCRLRINRFFHRATCLKPIGGVVKKSLIEISIRKDFAILQALPSLISSSPVVFLENTSTISLFAKRMGMIWMSAKWYDMRAGLLKIERKSFLISQTSNVTSPFLNQKLNPNNW